MGEMGRLRRPAWEAVGMRFSGMAWLGGAWRLGCRAGGAGAILAWPVAESVPRFSGAESTAFRSSHST